jgi:hypothetical protein
MKTPPSMSLGFPIRLLTAMLLLCSATSASADLVASPSQVNFGYQTVNSTSPPMTATLTNTGNQPLTVTAVTPATGVFARVGGSCGAPPFIIAAQANCTIQYTFNPGFIDTFNQRITLTMAGGSANFLLLGEGAVPTLVVNPPNLQWFFVPVGSVGEEKLAYLENDGPVPLMITEITTSSVPAASAFVQTGGNCPEPPFQLILQCAMLYTFVPAQVGQSTMEVEIRAGSAGNRSLSLSGVATPGDPIFDNGYE